MIGLQRTLRNLNLIIIKRTLLLKNGYFAGGKISDNTKNNFFDIEERTSSNLKLMFKKKNFTF
jgi:hypothetical protein